MLDSSKVLTSNDIILFEPSERSMILDYPELKNYPELIKLSHRDLKFVWYVSNRTSPIIKEPKLRRIKKACELAYDSKTLKHNKKVKDIYEECKFTSDIVDAIAIMSSFNPDFRMRAKLLNEYNFDMLQSLVYIGDEIRAAMDIEERKKFADLLIKTSQALHSIVTNMESGYGVKIKKEKEEEFTLKASVEDIIDRVEPTK